MKGMASASEYFVPPPEGTYPGIIIEANPDISKKSNATMLSLKVEGSDGAAKGLQFNDYIITDGTAKGGGMGKTKLRGLGVAVDSDAEVPDEVIARQLINKRVFFTLAHEPLMKGPDYKDPQTAIDPKTGATVTLMKGVIKGFSIHQTAGMPQPAPQPQAPQGYAQAPQGYAQPAQPQPAQQGFAPQPQYAQPQGFAQPAQQGFAPQPAYQQSQQGFAPPNGQPVAPQPQGFAPPAMAMPPWGGKPSGA